MLYRSALEEKSKLYDKLSKGSKHLTEEEIEYNRRYLVRFDKKSNFPPPEEEDDIDRYPESEEETSYYEPPKNRDEEWYVLFIYFCKFK